MAVSPSRESLCECPCLDQGKQKKSQIDEDPAFLKTCKVEPSGRYTPREGFLAYLLLQGAGCWQQGFLLQQAPSARVVAARAMRAAILVMVVMVVVRLLS